MAIDWLHAKSNSQILASSGRCRIISIGMDSAPYYYTPPSCQQICAGGFTRLHRSLSHSARLSFASRFPSVCAPPSCLFNCLVSSDRSFSRHNLSAISSWNSCRSSPLSLSVSCSVGDSLTVASSLAPPPSDQFSAAPKSCIRKE